MHIPIEVVEAILLWIFLSILTAVYLVKKFGIPNLLACLLLSIIFIGARMLIAMILAVFNINIPMLVFILATWIMFIASHGILGTEKLRTKEHVLFGSLALTYLALYIIQIIAASL
ncbi:MAG: hypothetical protein NDP13_05505 [Crenarchaeota archaeon]|nr:hypothetical protein [Thermoproteota archaeon]